MNIHFTGRNIEVTAALKTFTTEKMERLKRHSSHVTDVKVVFHIESHLQVAEATVNLNGTEIHATAKAEDLYSAIDELVDKLVALITKHKEKITDRR